MSNIGWYKEHKTLGVNLGEFVSGVLSHPQRHTVGPLDDDEVEYIILVFKATLNHHQGNSTYDEYQDLLGQIDRQFGFKK